MVATRKIKFTLVTLPLLTFLVLAYQNCSVDLSESTYGAASACEPTTAQAAAFDAILSGFLQNTGTIGGMNACGFCHLTTSGNPASARFSVLPGSTTAAKKSNFCSAELKASEFSAGFLSSGSHAGGTYNASDVQALVDWANSL